MATPERITINLDSQCITEQEIARLCAEQPMTIRTLFWGAVSGIPDSDACFRCFNGDVSTRAASAEENFLVTVDQIGTNLDPLSKSDERDPFFYFSRGQLWLDKLHDPLRSNSKDGIGYILVYKDTSFFPECGYIHVPEENRVEVFNLLKELLLGIVQVNIAYNS